MKGVKRAERGQAVAEFVLVVPMLLLLLLGAVDFGRYMYDAIEVGNAARAGVQYGAQSLVTAGDASGISAAAQLDAGEIAGISIAPSNFCTCDSIPGTQYAGCTGMPACPASDHIDVYVQVVASKAFTPLVAYPGIVALTVRRTAIQQVSP